MRALLARGHAVRAMARNPPMDFAAQMGPGALTMVQGDVLDEAALAGAMEGVGAVFHLAGMVSRDPSDADALYRAHVLGTRAVIEAARAAKVKRFVYASTSGTVGISDEPTLATEQDDPPVRWLSRFGYYRAKWLAEKEALAANSATLEVVSVNPSLLLGPGDAFGSSTDDVRKFLDRAIPATPRGGIAFVDARDAAEAMVLAFERGRPGERYLINGANMSVRSFFARLARASGVEAPALSLPKSREVARLSTAVFARMVRAIGGESPVDPASVEMGQLFWYVSADKAERELGWAPRDPQQTLLDTIRDLRGERTHAA